MGNNQSQGNSKLERKFSSLPSQNFPSHSFNSSFVRKSMRSSKRKKRQLSFNTLQKSKDGPLVFVDTLFLPEYPFDSHVNDQDFDILRVISTGSFGHVLHVKRRDTGIPFAMKVMNKTQILVDGAVKQCKEEVLIQDAVGHHPFIVKPYWFFQNKDNLFIVMEYIPNGELFSVWRERGCLREDLVRLYVAELALVLDFLHESSIIFRDLKMENILLDAQGHLQVTDFGLAKRLKRGSRTRTICGTLQYIAPEVLNSLPYGHPTDWWSLGILMYALLTGEYPVNSAANHIEMAKLVSTHVYELPPQRSFSLEARHAVHQLLQHNPAQRVSNLPALKSLPFFTDVNLDALLSRQISPHVYLECPDNAAFFESQESINGSLENLTDAFEDNPYPPPTHNGSKPDPTNSRTVPLVQGDPGVGQSPPRVQEIKVPDLEVDETEREQMRANVNQYFQQQKLGGPRSRRYQSLDMLDRNVEPDVWAKHNDSNNASHMTHTIEQYDSSPKRRAGRPGSHTSSVSSNKEQPKVAGSPNRPEKPPRQKPIVSPRADGSLNNSNFTSQHEDNVSNTGTLNRSTASSLLHVGNLTFAWNDSIASQEGSFV